MTSDLQPDPAAIRDFLEWVGGPYRLHAIPDGGPLRSHHGTDLDAAVRTAVGWNAEASCYWSLNEPRNAVAARAKRVDIGAVRFLAVDLDPRAGPDVVWEEERARLLSLLTDRLPDGLPRPTIIDSGGGFWGLWRVPPVVLPTDTDGPEWAEAVAAIEGRSRWIQQQFGGDFAGSADSIFNIDRIARLPGTVNWPNAKKRQRGREPALAAVVQIEGGFIDLDAIPIAPPPGGSAAARVAGHRLAAAVPDRLPDVDVDALPVSDRCRMLILHGDDPNEVTRYDGDRSNVVFAVLCEMARQPGIEDATMLAVILDPELPISAHVREQPKPHQYALRQVERARAEVAADRPVALEDFYSYSPANKCLFIPTRELWPPVSVNERLDPVLLTGPDGSPVRGDDGKPKKIAASKWLARNRALEQMTWSPGDPELIRGRLIADGGWIERPGASCFNLYRPPRVSPGDPRRAGPWLAHVRRVYGPDAAHVVRWLAHRVQRPGEKINHALVLGGAPGIGKDTLLEPVKHAVGPWNWAEVSPGQLMGRFNGFLKSVVLRVSEARDLGEVNRFAFYDHSKTLAAAPPDVLRCDEKHLREHSVLNVTGVVITTNHLTDGLYLPADDRRHFVAWSRRTKEEFPDDYWERLWGWYLGGGGIAHTAAYLAAADLSAFRPKAPPRKTAAFWAIVEAGRDPDEGDISAAIETLGSPPAVTVAAVKDALRALPGDQWRATGQLEGRKAAHAMSRAGYTVVLNPAQENGRWLVGKQRRPVAIYAQQRLSERDRLLAARRLLWRLTGGGDLNAASGGERDPF